MPTIPRRYVIVEVVGGQVVASAHSWGHCGKVLPRWAGGWHREDRVHVVNLLDEPGPGGGRTPLLGVGDVCDACAAGAASGDTNADGGVDLSEFADLNTCLLGPIGGLDTGCECFDFDDDGDNDLQDFAAFQVNFTGN